MICSRINIRPTRHPPKLTGAMTDKTEKDQTVKRRRITIEKLSLSGIYRMMETACVFMMVKSLGSNHIYQRRGASPEPPAFLASR